MTPSAPGSDPTLPRVAESERQRVVSANERGRRRRWLAAFGAFAVSSAIVTNAWADGFSRTVSSTSAYPEHGAATVVVLDDARVVHRDLGDELERVPGIVALSSGGAGSPSLLSIRGMLPHHTTVVIDGIELTGASLGAFDLSLIPSDWLRTARVHRSNVPLHLAAPSPGGVLALRTGFLEDSGPHFSATVGSHWYRRLTVGTQWESYSESYFVSASYLGTSGRFRYHDDNGTPYEPGDDDPTALRQNNHVNQGGLIARYHNNLWDWDLTGLGLLTMRGGGVAGRASAPYTDVTWREWLMLGGASAAVQGVGSDDNLDLNFSSDLSIARGSLSDEAGELGLGAFDRSDRSVRFGVAVKPTIWALDFLAVRLLVDGDVERLRTGVDGADERRSVARRLHGALGMETSAELIDDTLFIEGGLRADGVVDRGNVDNEPAERRPLPALYSPRIGLGLTRDVGHHTVNAYANWSQVGRIPTFAELFGDSGTVRGNADLRSEHRDGFDVGLGWRLERHGLTLGAEYHGYSRDVLDLITLVTSGTGASVYTNIESVDIRGHEGTLLLGIGPGWSSLSVSVIDAENTSAGVSTRGAQIPLVSPFTVDFSMGAEVRRFMAEARTHVRGPFYFDEANQRRAPLQLNLSYSLLYRFRYTGWSVGVDLNNALGIRTGEVALPNGNDEVVVDSPIVDYLGYPLPGPSFFVTFGFEPR